MADIFFDITGNGTASTTPTSPSVGEQFTFTATPYGTDTFQDVTCTDDQGYSVAVPQADNFTMTMPSVISLTFHVTFTGDTPTPPTPTPTKRRRRMPIWMYPTLRG